VSAIDAGDLEFKNLTQDAVVPIDVNLPVLTGRMARRRLVITGTDPPENSSWPEPGEQVRLTIPHYALVDFFGKVSTGYSKEFEWPGSDSVKDDETQPELLQVCVGSDGTLEVLFSEEPSVDSLSAAILVDGQSLTWILGQDRYSIRSDSTLAEGTHTLDIGTGALDLAGLGLASPFNESFEVGGDGKLVFSAPDSGEYSFIPELNYSGFRGRTPDPETGLIYFRNRYYDPELGRFIQTDLFGYGDGPNLYQFALNSPYNYSDPTGESATLIGGAAGGVVGGAYAGYRALRYGESYKWNYIAQGALAGAAIGFGIDTLGAGSGLSAAVIGGTSLGAGFGGATGSVMGGGSWGEFGK